MNGTRPAVLALAVAAAATGLAGCSSDDGGAPVDRAALADALYREVILPGYAGLAERSDELAAALTDACVTAPPTAEARNDAQQAWRDAQRAWSATRAYRFGPTQRLRIMAKIAYPVDEAKIDAVLAGTEPLDAVAVARLGADRRGLGAVELVLFGDDPIDERGCAFAVAAAEVVADGARTAVEAWAAEPPADADELIADSVNGMIFALADVADMRLAFAAGAADGTPAPAEIDRGPAHAALDDVVAVLDSVESMRRGGPSGGIGALLAAGNDDADRRLGDELAAARAAVATVPSPLADAPTAPVLAAYEAVRVPLVTMRTEVASLLGVTLQLGDADGDS